MNVPLIRANGCKNCKYAMATEGPNLECHWGPPTAVPIIQMGAKGPGVVGAISAFPLVAPETICWRYEKGVVSPPGQCLPATAALPGLGN